ncbi:hypothetical protein XBI1_340032 [Xenorhabdus bovienii str. Intermedium]|uniref:Uncharacterized protein n=1 Tax=Xenorhabdus bovienii str. Intermedium TaxID=1379677 RepID=A0A077QML2_XENBV|nr:hypothetical protein XBI1_340032 [Xenorhabdus bovienii str. Intermedium]
MLRKDNRIRTIQASLAIKHNSLSIEQVTAIINGKRVLAPAKDNQEVRNAILAYEKLPNWQSHRLTEICFPDAKINAKFLFTFLRMT